MNIIATNFKRISGVVLIFFFILGFGSISFAAKVEIYRGQLLVNGEPFIIKGVNYSPVPIGVDPETSPPYGDYFIREYNAIYERDLPLLREMGANTIRLMVWNNNGSDHTDFLNKLQNSGVKPIYAIITFSMILRKLAQSLFSSQALALTPLMKMQGMNMRTLAYPTRQSLQSSFGRRYQTIPMSV